MQEIQPTKLSDPQQKTVEMLRIEARSVKECFTKFSFQAIGFTVLILGAIAKLQADVALLGLCSIPLVLLLRAVTQIGTYKYGSANRTNGYELHLYRTTNLQEKDGGWHHAYKDIGWEQAMRAWRVIQTTLYQHLHHHGRGPHHLKREERMKQSRWYEPSSLIDENAVYYSGSYLRAMIRILHICMWLSVVPLIFMTIELFVSGMPGIDVDKMWLGAAGAVVVLSVAWYVKYRVVPRDNQKVSMLEKGLLSIHSCGIMWQAVVVGHHRALKNALAVSGRPERYTYYLSHEAMSLCRHVDDIYAWIDGDFNRRSPRVKLEKPSAVEFYSGARQVDGFLRNYSFDCLGVCVLIDDSKNEKVAQQGQPVKIKMGQATISGVCEYVSVYNGPFGRAREKAPKRHRVGVRVDAASAEDLAEFVKPHPVGV